MPKADGTSAHAWESSAADPSVSADSMSAARFTFPPAAAGALLVVPVPGDGAVSSLPEHASAACDGPTSPALGGATLGTATPEPPRAAVMQNKILELTRQKSLHFYFEYWARDISAFVERLDLEPGTCGVDLGCGNGILAQVIAETFGVKLFGIDKDEKRVLEAQGRLAGAYHGNCFERVSSEVLPHRTFDFVITHGTLHYQPRSDHAGLFDFVKSILLPGAVFAGEMAGYRNISHLESALRAALRDVTGVDNLNWGGYYPTADMYDDLLVASGFDVDFVEKRAAPALLELPQGKTLAETWLRIFLESTAVDADVKGDVLCTAEKYAQDTMFHNGKWEFDFVRISFKARVRNLKAAV